MRLWTRQVGYPVVSIPEALKAGGTVTQARFLASGDDGPGHWMLPVSALVGDDLVRVDLGMVTTPEDHQRLAAWLLEQSERGALVKINAGQTGFYRVSYNEDMWCRLVAKASKLALDDRLGVLADGPSPVARRGSRSIRPASASWCSAAQWARRPVLSDADTPPATPPRHRPSWPHPSAPVSVGARQRSHWPRPARCR